MHKFLLLFLLASGSALASTIAVIDSGTDYGHRDLIDNMWTNPGDGTLNGRDDDQNGYRDDIYGWNFAEQNNQIIDYKFLGTFSPDTRKFFEIQGKVFRGTATAADKSWMTKKRADAAFISELQTFGNFIHGTHVTGITVKGHERNKAMGIKLIPTKISPFIAKEAAQIQKVLSTVDNVDEDLRVRLIKLALGKLAQTQMSLLETIGKYVNFHLAEVANGSFGTGPTQAKMIADALYKLAYQKDPAKKMSDDLARHFLTALITEGRRMVDSSPHTLFVFAAGNDANDNDNLPTSPAAIDAPNVITVAASMDRDSLASFSSFGKKSVHLAAPGVTIESAIPGDETLIVSGTSQAAPFVANIAGQIRSINPKLRPAQTKKILMQTVDAKGFLKGKVNTEGIVNASRATRAAQLSLTMDLGTAIEQAKQEVSDIPSIGVDSSSGEGYVLPLPGMFQL